MMNKIKERWLHLACFLPIFKIELMHWKWMGREEEHQPNGPSLRFSSGEVLGWPSVERDFFFF
jgi:hypothetical protein